LLCHVASHDCGTDDCDDHCCDYFNYCDYFDYYFPKLWKLQRCLGPVRWQYLEWRHLLRLGVYVQQAEPVVLSVYPAVSGVLAGSFDCCVVVHTVSTRGGCCFSW